MALRLIVFLCLLSASRALYKQWIPDTNFERASNWDKERVPCANDRLSFLPQKEVSVYVQSAHSISEMTLPRDGEFILAPDAGFVASDGLEAGCEGGDTITFKDADGLQWFDPELWQAASSSDDLEKGNFLFSVHAESVPCQYDDVIFRPETSFRVNTSADTPRIPVRSVSILGKRFSSEPQFSQYLQSPLGRLQFHGDHSPQVTGSRCTDPSGCLCGNSENHQRICSAITQNCPQLDCKTPLQPTGHCCTVCGAIITLQFSQEFNLESYRARLQHLFLSQHRYHEVHMAVSKVPGTQQGLWLIPRQGKPEIQVVLVDSKGSVAEALAREIMEDIKTQGGHLGIADAELQTSGNEAAGRSGGVVAGAVIGALVLLGGIALVAFLFTCGVIRPPPLPSFPSWKKRESDDLGGPIDQGFDNPIFDKASELPEIPGLHGGNALNTLSFTQSGVHFVNPVYDETDLNV
ncbi:protein amnionless [Lepisosteus oculatus]|uniref:protein amnionless n=1 Tax=Lepisosteus oculatus TaxID=7918 RepID=UPI0037235221